MRRPAWFSTNQGAAPHIRRLQFLLNLKVWLVQVSSRLGLARLKRRSAVAHHHKAATIGSSAELEALQRSGMMDGSALGTKKPSADEILGGELVVNINHAQVRLACCPPGGMAAS